MEYLNEDNFKDLDKFIKECTDTSAAIGNLDEVTASIDGMFMIPVRASTPYVGDLHTNPETTLEDYEEYLSQGVELTEEEYAHYQVLLNECENNLKEIKKTWDKQ